MSGAASQLVSVVTAVHPTLAIHLPRTYASLRAQILPPGWEWEWVVQVDGDPAAVAPLLPPGDPRVRFGSGRPGGPGVARTLALASATGDLVQVLDGDDELTPGALARAVDVLADHPELDWVTCAAVDLLPDGDVRPWPDDPPGGPLPQGWLLQTWLAHGHRLPVHPATLCVRRGTLLALGGWMALPASEDTGLLLALDATVPGWFIPTAGLRHRVWAGQATAAPAHTDPVERGVRIHLVRGRAEALARRPELGPASSRRSAARPAPGADR